MRVMDKFAQNKYGRPSIGLKEVDAEFPETNVSRFPKLYHYGDPWVATYLRLPDPSETVRLRKRDKTLGVFSLVRLEDRGYFWWRTADGEIFDSWEVTHWAPTK